MTNKHELYTGNYFSKGDLIALFESLSSLESSGRSQWYAHVDKVKSISLLDNAAISFLSDGRRVIDKRHRFAAVLPFQMYQGSGCNGIICVRDELRKSVYDFTDVISQKEEWFPEPPKESKHSVLRKKMNTSKSMDDWHLTRHRIDEHNSSSRHGTERKSSGDYEYELERDIETVHDSDFPAIFLSLRFSSLQDGKIRRIGMYEALKTVKDFVRPLLSKSRLFWLILRIEDFEQTGLFTISQSTNYLNTFVRSKLSFKTFEAYLSKLHKIDDLVLDTLVFLNDARFQEKMGSKLYLPNIRTTKLGSTRSISPKLLSFAIYEAYLPPYKYLQEMHVRSKEISSSLLFEEKEFIEFTRKLELTDVNDAIYYLMNILHLGYSSEQPRKLVLEHKSTFHLCRVRNTFVKHGDSSKNRNKLIYHPYYRRVRTVTSSGYRIKTISQWMWISLLAGVAVPVLYIVLRLGRAKAEDIIGAASSIVASYILIMSPLIFQIFYRGEQLADVLANIRNVDTQEEFDDRKDKQTSELLQVIQKSKAAPRFLGGVHESNTSYTHNEHKTDAFNAREPMAFSNLEVLGYGLFEDAIGNIYMLDNWSWVYEMTIINHSDDIVPEHYRPKVNQVPIQNDYANDDLEFSDINSSSASFRCIAAKKVSAIEKLLKTEQNGTEIDAETGCIDVHFRSQSGNTEQVAVLSRILPFDVRKRSVEFSKERSIRKEIYWMPVRNSDLFDMHIGVEPRPISDRKLTTFFSSDSDEALLKSYITS